MKSFRRALFDGRTARPVVGGRSALWRALGSFLLVLGAAASHAAPTAPPPAPVAQSPWPLIEQLASLDPLARERAATALLARAEPALLVPLVDQLFFTPSALREACLRVLAGLAKERGLRRYLDWVEYLGNHPELDPPAGYLGWKGRQLSRIDPRFSSVLREGVAVRLRPGEIVSGGVRFDGIPSLDSPPLLAAASAHYLREDEAVFAAELDGDARAWPLRILSWHEMLNDRLGGEPVTLSYCTLCRSALLFRARLPDGAETTFGTSGLLYRSNKLMFDRRTKTLWSNLTGEPVLGPLASDPRPLEQLPLTLTTWGAWRRQHPETSVLALQPDLASRYGYDYRPGAADARRAGVSFPVPHLDRRLPDREEVYGLRLGAATKVYPLAKLQAAGLVEDNLGGEPVVLVVERASGAVRAYRRGVRRFRVEGDSLRDERGVAWQVEEEALVAADGTKPLPRLPGAHAYWFGWQAFYPASEVWAPAEYGPRASDSHPMRR